MKNDANLHARSPRGGRGGSFLPTSFRAISTYLRSNASNIASTVRSGVALPLPNGSLQEDERQREQVQWADFDKLELDSGEVRHVLLLTYLNGFQIWDVEEAQNVRELVSRRDGPVAFLRLQPKPYNHESPDGGGPLAASRPFLLVLTGDVTATGNQSPGSYPGSYNASGSPPAGTGPQLIPTLIRFYSLQSHTYVHVLRFRTGIHAVRCSPRVVVVALYSQIYCFDAASLQNTFSVLTYPTPLNGPGATNLGFGALAVGPRWLAYAANQPIAPITGRVSPQHLTPSPGVSPSTSPHNASLVAHYAKESSKHIAAGIVTLGDMGYKTLSRYYSELMPDGPNSPQTSSPSWKPASNGLGHNGWSASTPHEPPEYAGMVIVRDFVSKTILTQFRAHTSPLSSLAFDPSGTLLVTASIYGHNLNVFRLTPSAAGNNKSSGGFDASMTHVHLYKLYRGMTNAVIQDISFSSDSQWLAVSSSRGTSHIYAISPFGGTVGPQTHSAIPVDGLIGPTHIPAPSFPWWSSAAPLKAAPQPLPPPPQAVNLSVVSRIKNGVGGWRGTVTGAAAAATGRTNSNSGAVAAFFHDGGKHSLEADIVSGCLNEQLWVLSPSGHLIRYLLGPTGGLEGGYSKNATGVNSTASGGQNPSQELRLLIEPVERWDVSRKANWVEREERVDCLAGPSLGYEEEAMFYAVSGQRGGSGSHTSGSGNVAVGRDGMSVEEMQRWFMSNAEVQMHNQARPLPIWAKSKVYFHVMLPKESGTDGNPDGDSVGGEIEIEKIPTRVVEVRRKDLVPVIERLNVFTKVQGSREVASESIPAVSGLHMQLFVDDGLQEDVNVANFGGKHIHRTSSGSSFGSEGGPNVGNMNGFHHNYQDFPEISLGGNTPSAFDSPPSYFHHPQQQGAGAPAPFERIPAQGALLSPNQRSDAKFESSFKSQPLSEATGVDRTHTAVSPPLNFQRLGRRDVRLNSGYSAPSIGDDEEVGSVSGNDPSVESSGPRVEHETQEALGRKLSGVHLSSDLHVETKEYQQESKVEAGNRGEGVIGGLNGGIMALYDHMSPEDLGAHESQDSPIPSHHQPWDLALDNADMEPLIRLSPGGIVARDLDDRPEFLYGRTHEIGQAVAGMGHVQETGKVPEDAESTDAHSKSDDAVDPGDDAWEGAMFPFCEEDG
ncbi:hypothetical protein R1flu_005695 [Riccia fluitans]|uniref:BCAS3 domain-containing protein n=1 Tax=Riccia fluitans TaxID=41844 RepID=A0ABD1YTW7_9MARC